MRHPTAPNARPHNPQAERQGGGHCLRRVRQTTWVVLAAVLLLGACGDDGGSAGSDRSVSSGAIGEDDARVGTADSGSGSAVDACDLLTDDEAGAALGGDVVDSGPGMGPGESVCEWEIDGDWSITISVGSPDTAPGNSFDPEKVMYSGITEPVDSLDGAYYLGIGMVAFAVDDRLNTIQVVSPDGEANSRAAAEELAAQVAQRLAAATS
jgi:hypothetical protein